MRKCVLDDGFKVSEYLFKENKNTLKNIQALLYTHFYNISLNVLRPNFLNICNLPISHFPNIRKIRVKVGPKTNYFSYFMSSCTDSIVVFNNFFSLIFSQPRDKQDSARDFLLFKYFLNNLLGKKNVKYIIRKNAGTVLCISLLETCVQSLKLIV